MNNIQFAFERVSLWFLSGTVHIVIGTAGAGLETGGFSPMLGDWSLVQLEAWGYARLQATETTLAVQVRARLS